MDMAHLISLGSGVVLLGVAAIGGATGARRVAKLGTGGRVLSLLVGAVLLAFGATPALSSPGGRARPAVGMPGGVSPPALTSSFVEGRAASASGRAFAGLHQQMHLQWTRADSVVYDANLNLNGRTGDVLVTYAASGRSVRVNEKVKLQKVGGASVYVGSGPVDMDGNAVDYAPDRFEVAEVAPSQWRITQQCDEQQVCAPVEILQ
jgi:hypothetical protein